MLYLAESNFLLSRLLQFVFLEKQRLYGERFLCRMFIGLSS